MKIDRERFLFLATSISATTLALSASASPPPVVVESATPTVAATADDDDVSENASQSPEQPNPYKGTPITAQSCNPSLNNVGHPGACKLSSPGPTCESFGETKKDCPVMVSILKPRVAEAAMACLQRKSGTQEICEFNVTSICAYEALSTACLEPSAKSICNKVVAKCGAPRGHYHKVTQETCEAGVSGVADSAKAKFISCISEACRFETCLTYM